MKVVVKPFRIRVEAQPTAEKNVFDVPIRFVQKGACARKFTKPGSSTGKAGRIHGGDSAL